MFLYLIWSIPTFLESVEAIVSNAPLLKLCPSSDYWEMQVSTSKAFAKINEQTAAFVCPARWINTRWPFASQYDWMIGLRIRIIAYAIGN